MVKEKLLLNGTAIRGNPAYKSYIDRIGREKVLDQVRNHLILEQPISMEDKPIIITQELFIFTGIIALYHDDIEILNIEGGGMTIQYVAIADNHGHFFRRFVNLDTHRIMQIRNALASVAPHIEFGFTPEQQFAYKKRHEEELYNNAFAIMQKRYANIPPAITLDPEWGNLLYIPGNDRCEPRLVLTDRYLIVTNHVKFSRDAIEWLFIHRSRYNDIIQVFLNNGKDYYYQLRPSIENVQMEEMILGSLIPGAVVSYNLACKKWWQKRHNDTRASVFHLW